MFDEPRKVEDDEDVYSIDDFDEHVKLGYFIDYDGYGQFVKGGMKFGQVYPSIWNKQYCETIGVTHIVWYNR